MPLAVAMGTEYVRATAYERAAGGSLAVWLARNLMSQTNNGIADLSCLAHALPFLTHGVFP
jgi:hypothetical protein